jgi:hypothetical protein
MNIEFKWETFLEDDCSWDALFVKTHTKDWHLAEHHYGTENEDDIRRIIKSDSVDMSKFFGKIIFGLTICLCLLNYFGITHLSLVWVFSPIWISLLIYFSLLTIIVGFSVKLSL